MDADVPEARFDAVERAVTEYERDLERDGDDGADAESSTAGQTHGGAGGRSPTDGRLSESDASDADVADAVTDLEDRVVELEAAVQAIRGYVGAVRSVNDRVERRADAAREAVDVFEDRLSALEDERGAVAADSESSAPGPVHRREPEWMRGERPADRLTPVPVRDDGDDAGLLTSLRGLF